jgi:hypothetical protein
MLELDLDAYSEPASLRSEKYRDFTSYNIAIYSRGEFFFQQLRYLVGDATMHRIVRTFYDRWKLKHVDEGAFQSVAEEVSGRDLSTLFGQGLHATEKYDYAVGKVQRGRAAPGQWTTRVEVLRRESGRIPVEVAVIGELDTGWVRIDGMAEREWVEVRTRSEPKLVALDPRVRTHDWNMLNNRKKIGGFLTQLFGGRPGVDHYIHPYFSTRSRRDRLTTGWQPTLWYNDAGGVTLGVRSQSDYLRRFEQNEALLSVATGWGADDDISEVDFFLRAKNPVLLRAPNASQTFDGFKIEGRYGLRATLDWSRREHLTFGPTWHRGLSLTWVGIDDTRYLDPGLYDDVGTVELESFGGVKTESGKWLLSLQSSLAGGLTYNRNGLAASGRPELKPFYYRVSMEGIARRKLGNTRNLATRLYLGAVGDEGTAKQRELYVQGADPFQVLNNPFLRSRGSLLAGEDFNYHAPGGAGVRGMDRTVSTTLVAALNLDLEQTLLARPAARLFNRIAVAAFTDLAAANRLEFVSDAGVGLRADHRIGDTRFTTRFDLPLFVNRPESSVQPGEDDIDFRWVFSFEPSF